MCIFESLALANAPSRLVFFGFEPSDHFELMHKEAQKKQSRPLLFEEAIHTLQAMSDVNRKRMGRAYFAGHYVSDGKRIVWDQKLYFQTNTLHCR